MGQPGVPGRRALRRAASVALGTAAVGWLLSCAASSPPDPAPLLAAAPSAVPVATLEPLPAPSPARGSPAPSAQGSLCTVPAADQPAGGSADDRLVAVDRAPLSATLLWLPGLNSRICRVRVTTLDRPGAARLARDVLAAPAVSTGPTNCPSDDGTAVTAYFRYAGRTETEVIGIRLTGCSSIVAPHRRGRSLTAAIAQDLRPVAPPDWLSYVDSN